MFEIMRRDDLLFYARDGEVPRIVSVTGNANGVVSTINERDGERHFDAATGDELGSGVRGFVTLASTVAMIDIMNYEVYDRTRESLNTLKTYPI